MEPEKRWPTYWRNLEWKKEKNQIFRDVICLLFLLLFILWLNGMHMELKAQWPFPAIIIISNVVFTPPAYIFDDTKPAVAGLWYWKKANFLLLS